MRIFIVLDGRSQVSARRVWETLNAHCDRDEFEVLPLAASVFESVGSGPSTRRAKAHLEARRVLDRYRDATCCIVVYSLPLNPNQRGGKTVYHDHVLVKRRGNEPDDFILNQLMGVGKGDKTFVSSPKLQPQLTDALLEFAIIDVAQKY